jgi:hypothetical protein
MFGGVAVLDCLDITEGRWINERIRTWDSHPEMYFLLTDRERVLPVYQGGKTRVLPWGARRDQWQSLPPSPWVRAEDLDAGRLAALEPVDAVIRASRAVDGDVWFDVRVGVRAVLVRDGLGAPVVYPLVEKASCYYRGMTGSDWMPCLLRQRI